VGRRDPERRPLDPLEGQHRQCLPRARILARTEDLLALLNNGFLREKEVDMWRVTSEDPYPMEKSPDEIPMFT
jgi:hypothetical protein